MGLKRKFDEPQSHKEEFSVAGEYPGNNNSKVAILEILYNGKTLLGINYPIKNFKCRHLNTVLQNPVIHLSCQAQTMQRHEEDKISNADHFD